VIFQVAVDEVDRREVLHVDFLGDQRLDALAKLGDVLRLQARFRDGDRVGRYRQVAITSSSHDR
jgi:hypothetical protein